MEHVFLFSFCFLCGQNCEGILCNSVVGWEDHESLRDRRTVLFGVLNAQKQIRIVVVAEAIVGVVELKYVV